MKLEKRAGGETPETSSTADKPARDGNKPVVVYIMILFIAAFLLMALSFLMHQRSNTEALGELQSSVSAMQEIQTSQEKIIALQDELAALENQLIAAKDEKEDLEDELADASGALNELNSRFSAQAALYTLMQQYAARDYDACLATIAKMEANGWPVLLGDVPPETGVTPPSQRYQELKEAVEAKAN